MSKDSKTETDVLATETPAPASLDTEPPRADQSLLGDCGAAFILLSRIPVFWHRFPNESPPDFVSALWAFPLVGLVIGASGGAVLLGAIMVGIPPMVGAAVALFVAAMLAGAMHEDGLADMADGFGGGKDAAMKIRIMHDSRIGSYGVMALALTTAARLGLLMALTDILAGWKSVAFIALAYAASRFAPVLQLASFPISPHAKLALLTGKPGGIRVIVAALIWMVPLAGLAGWTLSLIAALAVSVTGLGTGYLANRQVNGLTGDVMGAGIILSEISFMTALIIYIGEVGL
ncbi:adenosylcobinamide-GDP ribazoletransferase [Alphaproteobacteria bacterium]|jgi:adenosylcobinamide-GDP ribazoletransferase|nr:adenosylcobinamide-GDP ribazoletransferase [Alphaproteobacteria bacterium]